MDLRRNPRWNLVGWPARTPFPGPLQEVDHLEIRGVSFGSTSSHAAQDFSAYAIADVILKRLEKD